MEVILSIIGGGCGAAEVLAYVQAQPEIRYSYAIDRNYVHMDVE